MVNPYESLAAIIYFFMALIVVLIVVFIVVLILALNERSKARSKARGEEGSQDWAASERRRLVKAKVHKQEKPQATADYFFNQALMHSQDKDIDKCLGDLTKAIWLDPSCRERALRDDALAWARTDTHVRRLLGMD